MYIYIFKTPILEFSFFRKEIITVHSRLSLSPCILKTSKTAILSPALQQQITSLLITYKQNLAHSGENQDLQHPPSCQASKKGKSRASSKGNCKNYSSLAIYNSIEILAAFYLSC